MGRYQLAHLLFFLKPYVRSPLLAAVICAEALWALVGDTMGRITLLPLAAQAVD